MGTFVYNMNTSVDLLIEQVPGDHGAGEWIRIDEELHEDFNTQARDSSLLVQGRIFYEIMEKAWPSAAKDATQPLVVREYGKIWVEKPKILVSRAREDAEYNTRVIGRAEDAVEHLAKVRTDTDGSIMVGGANLATQLLRAGLLDEILLYVHPAILGFGRSLFDNHDRPVDLELCEERRFTSGVVLHRYSVTPPAS